jgi:hypothetical protein
MLSKQERWKESVRKGRETIARVDAMLAERRAERPAPPPEQVHRSEAAADDIVRDVVPDRIEVWKRDADAATAARQREDRRRRRIEAETAHEQRQHSDAVSELQRDTAQHAANLIEVLKGVNALGEGIAERIDQMTAEIGSLRERLALAESKVQRVETDQHDLHAELNRAVVAQAVLKSELAEVRLELKEAVFNRRVAESVPLRGAAN